VAHRSESDDDRGVGSHAAGARTIATISDRIDELYGLTPPAFTAARNALAKELRNEGQRDEAAQVTKLRRPTIAAWAINQAVRSHRDRFAALVDAGKQVRRAQRRALSGVRDSGMRDATRIRRQLIDELTNLAAGILTEQGSSAESHQSDIAATFDAASADADAAEIVEEARLAAPLPVASGFGGLDGLAVLPTPEESEEPEEPERPEVDAGTPDADEAERERAARRRREAIRAVEAARREVARAETESEAAAEESAARAAAADDAARAARDAEVQWRRLQLEADSLQPQAAQARARAEKARQTVERLRAQLLEREQELAESPLDDD
jgi:hypothetical protein